MTGGNAPSDVTRRRPALDHDQTRAVEARGYTVVTAGAGSGKTTVLSERFLSLLADGAEVSSILTLTFTRKAAAEMHKRIYGLLAARRTENRNFETAFRSFDQARISTLDSFVSEIARSASADLGIPPTFSTDEAKLQELCMQAASEFLLSKSGEPVLRRLAQERGPAALTEEGLAPIAAEYMSPVHPTDFSAMMEAQLTEARRLAERAADRLEEFRRYVQSEVTPSVGAAAKQLSARFASVEHAPESPEEAERVFSALDGLRTPPSSVKTEEKIAFRAAFLDARDRLSTLRECLVLLEAEADMRRLYELLDEFQDLVIARKRASGQLSFGDAMELAIAVLEENEAVAHWYRQRIGYLMVDEFQDNNERQKRLLELVAGESGELFFVGDEKQSIYRFRGADVRVFKGLSEAMRERGGNRVELRTNYRSAPRLLSYFNWMFSAVLTGGTDYEAEFSPLHARDNVPQASNASPPRSTAPGYAPDVAVHDGGVALCGSPDEPQVRLFLREDSGNTAVGNAADNTQNGNAEDSALLADSEIEPFFVVETIFATVEAGNLTVPDGHGGVRPVRYEDIALLMRTSGNQYEYERMLRRFGIPYHSDAIRSLYLEAPANDLYALLQLCVYPADRYAYATVLRSPLVSIGDESMITLLVERSEPFSELTATLRRRIGPEDADRYERARALYDDLRGRADREPITSLLHTAWYDYGYRHVYLDHPANHGYLEYYDFLCALAVQYETEGLAAFLDAVRPQLGQFEKTGELEVLGRRSRGVNIMTVHRSKGLEFPVVFVVGCGSVTQAGRDSAGLWSSHPEHGVTINLKPPEGMNSGTARSASNVFLTRALEQNRAEEAAELRRLLYVAATRAQSHCVFSGIYKPPKDSSAREPNSFLELLAPLIDEGLPAEWIGDRTVGQRRSAGVDINAPPAPLLDAWYVSSPVRETQGEPSAVSPSGLNDIYRSEILGAQAVDSAAPPLPDFRCEASLDREELHAAFGTLAHWCAAEYTGGMLSADAEPATVARRLPERIVAAFPPHLREDITREAFDRAIRAVDELASRAGTIRAAHAEFPFAMVCPGCGDTGRPPREVRGSIDLLLETDLGPVVADFKTDRRLDSEQYRMQMDLYRRAAAGLFERDPRVVIISMRDLAIIDMRPLDDEVYDRVLV
ncbi:MAG: UvrD-helicase domain-containing protein [Spirochaetales bacterium]